MFLSCRAIDVVNVKHKIVCIENLSSTWCHHMKILCPRFLVCPKADRTVYLCERVRLMVSVQCKCDSQTAIFIQIENQYNIQHLFACWSCVHRKKNKKRFQQSNNSLRFDFMQTNQRKKTKKWSEWKTGENLKCQLYKTQIGNSIWSLFAAITV